MGLNWVLQDKIKEGYINEYKELIVKLNFIKDNIQILKIKTRLKELVIIPQEVAECKKVGINIEATEYIRNIFLKSEKYKSDPEKIEKLILQHHGKYVEHLVPNYKKDALAEYYSVEEGCLNFDGIFIGHNYSIPSTIRDEAFQDHNPNQMLEYANKMKEFIYDNEEIDYHNTEIIKNTIRWLNFWGSNGFGFIAKQ